jgi:ribosomal-protein-alanine N-acetyltransferase
MELINQKVVPPLSTSRLHLRQLCDADNSFIIELLNTEGWIRFIGNRNIHSTEDAANYIKKILANSNICYWVVELKDSGQKAGIISLIKRDYLDDHDIGFAFLPAFSGKGLAYEAASAILFLAIHEKKLPRIVATTIPGNVQSIRLLKKMGLKFEKELVVEKERLHLYVATIEAMQSPKQ